MFAVSKHTNTTTKNKKKWYKELKVNFTQMLKLL